MLSSAGREPFRGRNGHFVPEILQRLLAHFEEPILRSVEVSGYKLYCL
jgi:hypothetical protein